MMRPQLVLRRSCSSRNAAGRRSELAVGRDVAVLAECTPREELEEVTLCRAQLAGRQG